MREFMGKDFLIYNEAGMKLFEEYAKDMPIFDYHNHLIAKEIYDRIQYENVTQVWLQYDHYKWRAMRAVGVDEKYITGAASDFEKFVKWAETVEKIPGNPLYHWTHLELQRYFDVYEPLCAKTAEDIWNKCNEKLKSFDAYSLLQHVGVTGMCTTDEPFDTLEYHKKIKDDANFSMAVMPAYRPDKLIHIDDAPVFMDAIGQMGKRYEMEIKTLADLKEAMHKSILFFKEAGCIAADHGFIKFSYANKAGAEEVFAKGLAGESLTEEEVAIYKGEILRFLAKEYKENGFGSQFHLGANRNNCAKMAQVLGRDHGGDSVGETTSPWALRAMLNDMDEADALVNTVIYCLNPNDNTMMATMAVNFASSMSGGSVQFGSAWWFQDHVRGIDNQLSEMLETGLISTFVGMLTDSRSFTSFTRHEFFRRILCNKLGEIMENGEYPADFETMGKIVQDVCYNNAKKFFSWE